MSDQQWEYWDYDVPSWEDGDGEEDNQDHHHHEPEIPLQHIAVSNLTSFIAEEEDSRHLFAASMFRWVDCGDDNNMSVDSDRTPPTSNRRAGGDNVSIRVSTDRPVEPAKVQVVPSVEKVCRSNNSATLAGTSNDNEKEKAKSISDPNDASTKNLNDPPSMISSDHNSCSTKYTNHGFIKYKFSLSDCHILHNHSVCATNSHNRRSSWHGEHNFYETDAKLINEGALAA